MSCDCNDSIEIAKFPTMLFCTLKTNYDAELVYKKALGEKGEVVALVNLKLLFKNAKSIQVFAAWYLQEIRKGRDFFLIEIELFGKKAEYEARIANRLKESELFGLTRTISLKLIIRGIEEQLLDFNICIGG